MKDILNNICVILESIATLLGVIPRLIRRKKSKERKQISVKTKGNNNTIQVGNNNVINRK